MTNEEEDVTKGQSWLVTVAVTVTDRGNTTAISNSTTQLQERWRDNGDDEGVEGF